jgi:UDP-N-acetylmuramoyl-tripeptide--D-alanyl-D-alanine ligase
MYFQLTNILSIIILLAFVVRTIRNTLYYLFLWQNKEYRLDRMLIHFKTKLGRKLLFGPFSLVKLFLVFTFSFAALTEQTLISNASIWTFGFVILLEAYKNIREIYFRSLPLPEFSLKIALIFFITIFLQLIFVATSSYRPALDYLPYLDKSLGLMVAFQIALFSIPARTVSALTQVLARDKISGLGNLKVIGITGSYGKTSTKEFVAQLLSAKFNVAKTPANNNTAIGIAKTILRRLDKKTDYFVMEAAAYKRGEIKEITTMVRNRLQIAVITGINAQHLDLFGKIENIKSAKYELVQNMNKDGLAIFNANNIGARKLSERAKKEGYRIALFGNGKSATAYAANIKQAPKTLSFDMHIKDKKARVTAHLIGKHNIENILLAALVASEAKVPFSKITRKIKELKAPKQTMVYKESGETILIDDSYNANPNGVEAALDYLKIYECPKILVLRPLIELGAESDNVHERIGTLSAKICDAVILTNDNYYKSFMRGVRKANNNLKVIISNGAYAKNFVDENYKGKKVILFEGREAENALTHYYVGVK